MTVKELIEKLKEFDENQRIGILNEIDGFFLEVELAKFYLAGVGEEVLLIT